MEIFPQYKIQIQPILKAELHVAPKFPNASKLRIQHRIPISFSLSLLLTSWLDLCQQYSCSCMLNIANFTKGHSVTCQTKCSRFHGLLFLLSYFTCMYVCIYIYRYTHMFAFCTTNFHHALNYCAKFETSSAYR